MGNRSSSKSQSFDVSDYPIFYFAQILYRWDANLAIEFESQRLDHSDWRMLGALQYRDAQTIKELARLISFDPSFISRLARSIGETRARRLLFIRRRPSQQSRDHH